MSRIIAGRRGGHPLVTPPGASTRPTSDKVREAAFSAIASWAGTAGEPADTMLERFSFLDLYAGSGAVGLEAASRGAGPVVCVERDRATAGVARRNADALDLDVGVVVAAAEGWLEQPRTDPFDIVWLDPPYPVPTATVERLLDRLCAGGWLAPDGLIVAERSSRDAPPAWPAEVKSHWSRRYGETTLYFATPEDDHQEDA